MLCMTTHRPLDHDVTILFGDWPSPYHSLVALIPSNLVSKEGQAILLFPRNEWVDRHIQSPAPQNTYTRLGISINHSLFAITTSQPNINTPNSELVSSLSQSYFNSNFLLFFLAWPPVCDNVASNAALHSIKKKKKLPREKCHDNRLWYFEAIWLKLLQVRLPCCAT